MPELKTEITEIVTGLGMTGIDNLDDAIAARPAVLLHVKPEHWDRLEQTRANGEHLALFDEAFANGRAFLESNDGLRGRVPLIVEWKGSHKPPGYELIPADLRVDHVFLISCKYQSKILANSSPSNLFDRRFADRTGGAGPEPWYSLCAPTEYDDFYEAVRDFIGHEQLPQSHTDLLSGHLEIIRAACTRVWPDPLKQPWASFSFAIASASARRWNDQLDTAARREEMLWRLLRLSPAPYFLLGMSHVGMLRIRIGTPWDWRQLFKLESLVIEPTPGGQPVVSWAGYVTDTGSGLQREVKGHVEVRWAHGRFSSVEAKIYLDTPHPDVPGYFPIG